MQTEVLKIIQKLGLQPHPEGGYYRETYRSNGKIGGNSTAEERNISTAIYFLLLRGNFSAFHRISSDEVWHFYAGAPIYVHVIDKEGTYTRHKLYNDLAEDSLPQLVVPAGAWFGSSVEEEEGYGLAGCTVAPGFDFRDFEMAQREQLLSAYPQHRDIIIALTRG